MIDVRHSEAKHDIDYGPYGYSCNDTSSNGLLWMKSDASRGLLGNHCIICLMLHDISLMTTFKHSSSAFEHNIVHQ